jgi:hypothetical protein
LRVSDGGQRAFIEDIEVEMQPRRPLREPGGASAPTLAALRSRTSGAVKGMDAGPFSRATSA